MAMTLRSRGCRSWSGAAAAAAVLLTPVIVSAQPTVTRRASAPHVTVELITDRDVAGAATQWLGLRFTLDPGWHIYWLNPGDSGGPPDVHWQLPAGMMVGPLEWPVPQRIDAGDFVNYGYLHTVVLPARLVVAAGVPAAPAVIRASIRWLVCRDLCVSGQGSVELRFPLAGPDRASLTSWGNDIRGARELVPQRAPPTWTASATAGKIGFALAVRTGRRESHGFFFPLEPGQIDDSAPQALTPLVDGFRLELRKSAQLVKDPAALHGVVSLPDGRSFEIAAPVSR